MPSNTLQNQEEKNNCISEYATDVDYKNAARSTGILDILEFIHYRYNGKHTEECIKIVSEEYDFKICASSDDDKIKKFFASLSRESREFFLEKVEWPIEVSWSLKFELLEMHDELSREEDSRVSSESDIADDSAVSAEELLMIKDYFSSLSSEERKHYINIWSEEDPQWLLRDLKAIDSECSKEENSASVSKTSSSATSSSAKVSESDENDSEDNGEYERDIHLNRNNDEEVLEFSNASNDDNRCKLIAEEYIFELPEELSINSYFIKGALAEFHSNQNAVEDKIKDGIFTETDNVQQEDEENKGMELPFLTLGEEHIYAPQRNVTIQESKIPNIEVIGIIPTHKIEVQCIENLMYSSVS